MEVILLTAQCLQERLHLSVRIIVPKMDFFRFSKIVLMPKAEKYKKVDSFIISPCSRVIAYFNNSTIFRQTCGIL